MKISVKQTLMITEYNSDLNEYWLQKPDESFIYQYKIITKRYF